MSRYSGRNYLLKKFVYYREPAYQGIFRPLPEHPPPTLRPSLEENKAEEARRVEMWRAGEPARQAAIRARLNRESYERFMKWLRWNWPTLAKVGLALVAVIWVSNWLFAPRSCHMETSTGRVGYYQVCN